MKEKYHLYRFDDLFHNIRGLKVVLERDQRLEDHHVWTKEEYINKTTFRDMYEYAKFLVMQVGLVDGSISFMFLMNAIFGTYLD